MQCSASLLRSRVQILAFKVFLLERFSNVILFILIACVFCKKPNWVWEWATNRYGELVMALLFVSFFMVLALFTLFTTAAIFNITFYLFGFFLFTDKSREYVRVLWTTIKACAEKCILRYAAEDYCLILFELVLFYWRLDFVAMHITRPFFWLCVNIW